MRPNNTESLHPRAHGLDLASPEEIGAALLQGQIDAISIVGSALPAIVSAAAATTDTIRSGGRLIYAAAGSSGLMALADAVELPGTYGVDRNRIVILFAGGMPTLDSFRGGPEDDTEAAIRDVGRHELSADDCMIVLSASGSTPYALAAAREARRRGARTIAIANNAGSPLLAASDIAILLATPAELVAGSTRMGAGTAQKVALNMISTLMAFQLGHVVDGQMVNLVADNAKLRERAARIVANLAHTDNETALACLDRTDGAVKPATLLAAGVGDLAVALKLLQENNQNVRSVLTALEQGDRSENQRA